MSICQGVTTTSLCSIAILVFLMQLFGRYHCALSVTFAFHDLYVEDIADTLGAFQWSEVLTSSDSEPTLTVIEVDCVPQRVHFIGSLPHQWTMELHHFVRVDLWRLASRLSWSLAYIFSACPQQSTVNVRIAWTPKTALGDPSIGSELSI